MGRTLEGVRLELKGERGSGEQRKELDISSKGRKRHRKGAGTGATEAEHAVSRLALLLAWFLSHTTESIGRSRD